MPRRTSGSDSGEAEKHDPNAFERFLEVVRRARPDIADAWVEVGDTAEGAKKWLSSYKQVYTAADVIAMTQLVMAQHRATDDPRRRDGNAEIAESLIEPILEELRALSERIDALSKEVRRRRK